MNILLICYVYPPEHAPAGVMTRELAEDLSAAGHRVTVLTGWPNHPKGVLYPGWKTRFRAVEYADAGYRVIRCGHSIHPRYRMFWRVWHYLTFALSTFINGLATGPVDVVCHTSTPFFGVAAGWLLAKCKGARVVYTLMDLVPEAIRNAGLMGDGKLYRMLRRLDTFICRKSQAVVTLSEQLKSGIVARGVSPDSVKVVPLWLDHRRIQPGRRDNPWRREQGIPADKFVALFAGTIGYTSGAEVFLDTASLLAHREDILLLFVGEGPVKKDLEDGVASRGLRNVRFLPFQPEEVLSDMQATADVGLVTLLPGGGEICVPSKVIGYIAAGRPVIAGVPADSPTASLIRDGQCGTVTPCEDAAALADAIGNAADNREHLDRLGKNAREFFIKTYDRKTCTKAYESILTGK